MNFISFPTDIGVMDKLVAFGIRPDQFFNFDFKTDVRSDQMLQSIFRSRIGDNQVEAVVFQDSFYLL